MMPQRRGLMSVARISICQASRKAKGRMSATVMAMSRPSSPVEQPALQIPQERADCATYCGLAPREGPLARGLGKYPNSERRMSLR